MLDKRNSSGSKELPIGKVYAKGPMKKRLLPVMLSNQNHASAHYYVAVIGLKVTEDDMYLLSASSFLLANARNIRIIHVK